MTILKLSDVEVGTPTKPRQFDNEQQKYVEVDPQEAFLDRLHDRKTGHGQISQSLFLRKVEMAEDASLYHRNYMEYLELCWGQHLGIVVTPDILWFTALSQIVGLVKEAPNTYRELFSESDEKQTITIDSSFSPDGGVEMPLNHLVGALRHYVPTDTGKFIPQFSTTSNRSTHAMYAVFCDMCSPYYNYMMFSCNFPHIAVQGSQDDWSKMANMWLELAFLFEKAGGAWFGRVLEIFDTCASDLTNTDWWREMFKVERCGSGSQTEILGWYADMFREQPQSVRFSENFPTTVAAVDYTNGDTGKDYRMQDGLFYSYLEGEVMVPDFGYTIHERMKVEPESFKDWQDRPAATERFLERVKEL
jgi:hypothetical protein